MIHLLHLIMLNVWHIHLGNNITSRIVILWKLTNYAFPSLLFVCSFCKRLMEADSWDTLDATRHSPRSPRTIIGPRCFAMSPASPTGALHVAKLSHTLNPMVYICLYLFHINLGKTLAWILCLDYQGLKMARTLYLLLWTDSLKWLILYHATR